MTEHSRRYNETQDDIELLYNTFDISGCTTQVCEIGIGKIDRGPEEVLRRYYYTAYSLAELKYDLNSKILFYTFILIGSTFKF